MLATTGKFAAFQRSVSQRNRAQRTPGEPYRRCKGSQKLDGSVFLANVPLLPGAHSGHVSSRAAAAASRRLLISVRESSDLDRLLCRSRSPYCGYSPFLLLSFLLCRTASNQNRGQNSDRSLPRSVSTTFKFLKTPERTTARAGLSCAAFRAASFASQFVAHRKNIGKMKTKRPISRSLFVCVRNNPQCKSRCFTKQNNFSHD